ncbi:MFS transporter [Nocardia huaxiensis]|uniref:MFS transporter n=1 Tax=Nocardia huaxiensis TaxID=2755382 RepID=UPI001E413F46|nr:MFS transporter [Nocardia huaxiensis]UFS98482.1 MFS transporter [Nocardia huaxiensis]
MRRGPAARRLTLGLLAIALLGLTLRSVFGSAAAVLPEIMRDYRLGTVAAALLTTGPVLCFGLFGALTLRLVRHRPVPAVLAGCLLVVAAGTALRGIPAWEALVFGTLLAGAGIAMANVLGPVVIRMLFPHRLGVVTGVLTALVSASAGIASGVTVPLDRHVLHSWRMTLLAWAGPAVIAAAALAAVAVLHSRTHGGGGTPGNERASWDTELRRSPTAWAITGFMGIQSLLAYSIISWLPTLYRERGIAAEQAGLVSTAVSVAGIGTALVVPALATRLRAQSGAALAMVALSVIGLTGVLAGGAHGALAWAVLLGLGQGGQLSLALTLINLRAASAVRATGLSAMAQSIGYLIAASGPVLTGALRAATGSWSVPVAVLLLLMVPLAVCGYIAGKPREGSRTWNPLRLSAAAPRG